MENGIYPDVTMMYKAPIGEIGRESALWEHHDGPVHSDEISSKVLTAQLLCLCAFGVRMDKLKIPQSLYKQFLCGRYCDLQIQVENSYFRAHSCVVAAASWVLEAILESSTSEDVSLSKLSIQLHGVTAYAISCLLGFIYTGKFPPETYHDTDKRREVLHAAKLYKMEEVAKEFEVSPPSSESTRPMTNLQILGSESINDSILDNLVQAEDQAVLVQAEDQAETAGTNVNNENSVELQEILIDGQIIETGEAAESSSAVKLSEEEVKKYVTENTSYAKDHGIIYCVLCGRIFPAQSQLISHMADHKERYRKQPERAAAAMASFVVDDDDAFADFGDDADYSVTESNKRKFGPGKKTFACSDCGAVFSGKVYLIKHYNSQHPGSIFCKYCLQRFESDEVLQIHILTHRSQDEENGDEDLKGKKKLKKKGVKSFGCNLCSTSFEKRRELMKHRETIHGITKPMHPCTICGKQYKEKQSLRAHTRVHTGEKPYMCSYCGNSFADAKTWKDHERRHRGEKPFLCTTCGKSFTYRQSFTRHMKFHEGKRPFQCSFCGKAFVLRQNMKEHEKRHNK